MHNFKIEYSETYESDLFKILDYITLDDVTAALNFNDEIAEVVSSLKQFPFKGSIPNDRNLRVQGYRKLVIGNYIVFYIPYTEHEAVFVHRILSAKIYYPDLF